MHIPSLESVYQAMVIQHDILNRQRVIIADIARIVQEKRSSSQIPLISSAVLARVCDKEAVHLHKGYSLFFSVSLSFCGLCLIILWNRLANCSFFDRTCLAYKGPHTSVQWPWNKLLCF